MDKEQTAVKTTETAAPQKVEEVKSTTTTTDVDTSDRIAELEAEKAKILEESANYKLAFLKEKSKNKNTEFFAEEGTETDEEKTRRIIREELANNKIAQIDNEKELLLKKLAKENKELKLANLNKTSAAPSSLGSEEGDPVRSTLITPEQAAAFKARGWNDKDIERYKKNLQRYSGR